MSTKTILFGGIEIPTLGANAGLAVLRVYAGLALAFAHGLGKIPPSDRFIAGIANMGFPLPEVFAWMSGTAEFLGGILLALGLLTRPAAAFIAINMAVAFFLRHAEDPFRAKELAGMFLVVATAFIFIGSGRFGLDRIVRHN